MPRTVSASEAKNRLGEIISWVLDNDDEVIVESRGIPKVVMMPFEEYEKVKEIKERERRQEALAALRRLRNRVRERNRDLTPEEGDALASRFSREVVDDMEREGMIKVEQ